MTKDEAEAALLALVNNGWLVYDADELDDDEDSVTFGQTVRVYHWSPERTHAETAAAVEKLLIDKTHMVSE